MISRSEHLNWCKKRALDYIDRDDSTNALASMLSDLEKHDETKNHAGINLGVGLLMIGSLSTTDEMRKFIEGFH